jgi:hypothetical protein
MAAFPRASPWVGLHPEQACCESELEDLMSAPASSCSRGSCKAAQPTLCSLPPNLIVNESSYFSCSAWHSSFLLRSSSRAISPSLTFASKDWCSWVGQRKGHLVWAGGNSFCVWGEMVLGLGLHPNWDWDSCQRAAGQAGLMGRPPCRDSPSHSQYIETSQPHPAAQRENWPCIMQAHLPALEANPQERSRSSGC